MLVPHLLILAVVTRRTSWLRRAAIVVTASLVSVGGFGCDLGHLDPPTNDPSASGPSSGCSGACHGEGDLLAPPRDTAGRTDLKSIGIGAHTQHLQGSDWHKRFACETCHIVPVQVGDLGHIFIQGASGLVKDPLPAEVVFTGLGTNATWDHDTATCTNSYCHGDTLHQTDPSNNQSIKGAGGTLTQPMWTQVDGTQSKCGSCHGTPPPAPHPQNEDCGLCHQSMNPGDFAVGKISYPELHINGLVEVTSTQPCDTCHGSGGNSAPPRDAHNNTATSAPGVGAHAQHMVAKSPWHAPIACNECHLVPGSSTDQTHVDQIDEVYLDPTLAVPGSPTGVGTGAKLQIPGATWDASALTCSGTYCHGGNKSPLRDGLAMSPKWTKVDGTQVQCTSCHGMPPKAPHPVDSDCGKCHTTMTPGNNTTITYPNRHIDGNVDVINDKPCDSCHGGAGNPAPPLDTNNGMSTDLRGVGAHRSHLNPSTWRADITCDQCHKVPASMQSIGHIDTPLPAEVIFGNLAGLTAAWNGTTCSNVYCHGATLKSGTGAAGGTATRPVWTVVNGAQSQCGSCHGTPPPPPHPVDSDCGKCHPTMTPGGGLVITDPAKHIDGNLDVNTNQPCNSCHGGVMGNAPPKDTQGNTATTARGVGAHQAHLNPTSAIAKPVVCTDCHVVPATVTSVGHIDTPLPAEVKFSGRAGTSPTWNGAQCSNVYCHGATLTTGPAGGGAGGTATSPLWQKVDGTQKQCNSCHGFPPPSPHINDSDCGKCHLDVKAGLANNMTFLDTTKHIDGNLDVTDNQACNACHGGTNNAPPKDTAGNTATTLRGVGAHQAHVVTGANWHRDIACGECHLVPATRDSVGHIDTPLPAEVIFSGIGGGGTWNGANCSSYCHGTTLKASAGTPAGGTVTSPVWTKVDGTQKLCTSCHGSPPPAPHPANNACDSCHMDAGPNQTIKTPAMHIDGTVQVTAGSNHPAGYNAREQHGWDFDAHGSTTCATSGCHGVALTGGTTGGPSCNSCHTANWQTDCKFCHGTTANGAPPAGVKETATLPSDPAVGAHAKHVNATTMHVAWDCNYCHTKPSTALTPGHIDGTGGIIQAEVVFSSLNSASSFSFTTNTCASSYCHGTGNATKTTPAWTSTTQLACVDGCHGGSPSYTGMSSEHRRSDHKRSCATCHKSVVDGTPNIISATLHVNGAKDVQFSAAGSSYNATNKSCTGTGNGCHGTGTRTGWK